MGIHRFSSSPFNVNSYIIEKNGHLLMVDPILTVEVCKIIEKTTVDFAILTHEHYDHILSVNEINGNNLFPVHCGQATALAINDPRKNLSRYSEFLLEFIPFVDKAKKITIKDYTCECHDILHDGQSLSWQGHELFVKKLLVILREASASCLTGSSCFPETAYSSLLRPPSGCLAEAQRTTGVSRWSGLNHCLLTRWSIQAIWSRFH